MDIAIADSNHPDLCVRTAFAKLVACFQFIGINGERSGLDVDSRILAVVVRLELGADFVDNGRGKGCQFIFFLQKDELTPFLLTVGCSAWFGVTPAGLPRPSGSAKRPTASPAPPLLLEPGAP